MQIVQVDLKNVKSFQQGSVVFTAGTNAVCGPNGAGKSTLVEAIGFALFDSLPYTHSKFVREGEKTATITVHLVGEDGRVYQVVRKCGSSNQYYIYDPEVGKLTTKSAETKTWLREFMEVEETTKLSVLFEDAVGVPQGLLTAAFLDQPSKRKDTFNPLLRVDEYERVWKALLEPRRRLETSINEQEKQIAGFEAEVKTLPGLRKKATGLRTKIGKDEKRQAASQVELEEVTQRKEGLEAVKERLDELKQAVTQAEAEVKTLGAQLGEAQSAVEQAEQAQSVIGETEAGHQTYLAAQANLEELEQQREERDRLNEVLQAHTTDLALAQQKVEGLGSDLEAISKAEAKMEPLRPQVETQEQLERELTKAQRAADRLSDLEQNLAQEQTRLAELEASLSDVQAGLAKLVDTEQEIESLEAELDGLDEQRNELTSQIAATQAELDQLQTQTASLEAAETATCPVCEGPLTPEHRSELMTRNEARQEEIETALNQAQSQHDKVEKRRQRKQKALDKLEKRAKGLPRPAEAGNLSTQIEAQKKAVTKIERKLAKLADTPAEIERLMTELAALGDPRRDYQRLSDTADRRSAVEKDLATSEGQITELNGEIDATEKEMAAFADLDERTKAERAVITAQEADYQRYLGHIREAEALGERQEKAAALGKELKTTQAECERVVAERDQVAAGYDAEAYVELTKTYRSLQREVAKLEERLYQQRGQLEEAQAEIDRLIGVQAELEATRAEREELGGLLALLEYIRQVLRDAGPKVTQALVEVISIQAARLYSDIMADHTARLRWAEDYEIVLMASGRERVFKQLSGGEQMAAALAVRLALLRQVSGIDVAFFDEPTANLDDHRRDNLAEQILNIKGFSQLFVISHDDTFERDTDNVVRLVKENGVSRVEE